MRSASNPGRRLKVSVTGNQTPVSQAINNLGGNGVGEVYRTILIIYQWVSEALSSSGYPQSCQISISIHYLHSKLHVHLYFLKVTNSPTSHQHFFPYPQPSHQLVNEKCKLLITLQHTFLQGWVFPLFLSKPGQSWLLFCGSEASLYAKLFVYIGCTTHLPQVKAHFSTMAHVQVHFALLWFGINSSQMEKTEKTLMNVSKYFPTCVLQTNFAFFW